MNRFVVLLALAAAASTAHAHVPRSSVLDTPRIDARDGLPIGLESSRADPWAGANPELRARLERIYATLRAEGFDVRLVEAHRSDERQAQLLASRAGVTQIGPGRSCHNHGLAADSAVFVGGRASWTLADPHVAAGYARYGALAQSEGLRWGGAWRGFQDHPHVELAGPCRVAVAGRAKADAFREWVARHPPIVPFLGQAGWAMTLASGCTDAGCAYRWASVPSPGRAAAVMGARASRRGWSATEKACRAAALSAWPDLASRGDERPDWSRFPSSNVAVQLRWSGTSLAGSKRG